MKTKKYLLTVFTGVLFLYLRGITAQAQQTDTTMAASDTTMSEELPSDEVEYQDTTTITFGRKNRIVIVSDDKGNNEVKLITRRGPEYDEENWDQDGNEDDSDKRKNKYSEVGFLAFDLGVTNYYNDGEWGVDAANPDLELKTFRPGSHVALHFLPTTVSLLGKGTVNLKTAITIDWNNYYFTEDVQLKQDQEALTFERTGVDYDKNKLMVRYAQIPLMLNINSDPRGDDGVNLSVGGYMGVLWGARTKQKSGEFGKQKIRDEFNLNNFRYGLTARLDIKWLDFYFNLNLSQLFDEDEDAGINAQTFNAGINVFDF